MKIKKRQGHREGKIIGEQRLTSRERKGEREGENVKEVERECMIVGYDREREGAFA